MRLRPLLRNGSYKIHFNAALLLTLSAILSVPAVWALQSSGTANAPVANTSKPQTPTNAPAPAANQVSAGAKPKPYAGIDPRTGKTPEGIDPETGLPWYETIQEDWSSLQVGVSKLEPEPPLVAQTDEGEGFTRTLIQLKWRPGDPVDLYVILPKGVKRPPAVLYLYSYLDDTDRFRDNGWAHRATAGGVAAIGFASALSGHRFHGRPMEQWFVSELQESLGSTVHDVHFILDYLAQRGDIDMDRIGMFGQASGGAIALLAAAAEPRIKAVDALDPWGDWPVWLAKSPIIKDDPNQKDFASDAKFLQKVAPLDPVKWLPTLKSTQVRIQQVMDNIATPDACKNALKQAAPRQAEVIRFNHVSELGAAESGGRLFDWVKESVKNAPEKATSQSAAVEILPQTSERKH